MEKFKLGKKLPISLPSNWSEVPFEKGFQLIKDQPDEIETMSILAGVPKKDIEDATNFESIYYLMTAYDFLKSLPDLTKPQMPLSLVLDGERIIFPNVLYQDQFDLGEASVGQFKDMQMQVANMVAAYIGEVDEDKEPRNLTELETISMCPYLVAIYIQKLIDKEYDYKKAMKLVSNIEKQLSFFEVTNIGYFFLQRLAALKYGQAKNYQKPNSITRKLRRGYWTLTRHMASMLP